MTLDRIFAREISKVNGNGSQEARLTFLRTVRKAQKALSAPDVMRTYGDCIKQFGRVPIAICTAVTIYQRRDRLNDGPVCWATEVLKLWTNRPNDLSCAYIDDGLHPSRIEEYARSLIELTTDEQ